MDVWLSLFHVEAKNLSRFFFDAVLVPTDGLDRTISPRSIS